MPRLRLQSRRRLVAAATTCALAAAVLVAVAGPAEAAVAAPWRWAKVTSVLTVPARSNSSTDLVCPGGYVPVSGGMTAPNSSLYRMLEYPNPGSNGYTFTIGNSAYVNYNVDLVAWCANASDVGPIDSVTASFVEGTNGRAAGQATCPEGEGVLSGGVDWGTTGDRNIDYSGPNPNGGSWFASGISAATNDTLYIEVRCVPNSSLANEVVASSTSGVLGGGSTGTQTATCPAGTRVMTGGSWARAFGSAAFDLTNRGRSWVSSQTAHSWTSTAAVSGNSNFTAIAICIPADKPVIQFTQTPASLSNVRSGTLTFTASDPLGQSMTVICNVDGGGTFPCSSGSPVSYGPLGDGTHYIQVVAQNSEGELSNPQYLWQIDATTPTVAGKSATTSAPLGAPFVFWFSEATTGVDATTFRVFPTGSATPLAGQITTDNGYFPPKFAFQPDARLVPGGRYTVELGTAIHDAADNHIPLTTWQVRTSTSVQNASVDLVESWDPDASTAASGGHYISSKTAGSKASLGFSSVAGDDLAVWGIRGPDGGYADVYLDGVKRAQASFYAKTARRARVFQLADLPSGTHELEIRVLGRKPSASTNTWVRLDSVDVAATTWQETALRQVFRKVNASTASAGSYDTVSHATAGDNGGRPGYALTFRGTSIKLYGAKTRASGKAKIYVDGVLKGTVDFRASSTKQNVRVFTATLANKVHVIRVVAVGTTHGARSAVNVDRLVIG
ncbi:MAG: hypothetical protein QOJ03_3453 [Frankiaceae bacterium]|nr:hypothetical protein [Frankiaceae bacterium]